PPVTLYRPVRLLVPPENLTEPAPSTLPLRANVPPPKARVAPAATLKSPLQMPPQAPPPEKVSVPPLALELTAWGLLKMVLTVCVVPPVIWKVPALLKVLPMPPLARMPLPLEAAIVQVEPKRLLTIAPF